MNTRLENLVLLVDPNESLQTVITRLVSGGRSIFGLAIVVDSANKLLGLVNSGDILRSLADQQDLDRPVSELMTKDPVTVPIGLTKPQIIERVRGHFIIRSGGKKEITRYIPVVDNHGIVLDVVDLEESGLEPEHEFNSVEVYGLGFVGLTLAVAMTARGHFVTGIDVDHKLIGRLNDGNPHVFEPRLTDTMRYALETGTLVFRASASDQKLCAPAVIIAVGTPVDQTHRASLVALQTVCETVASRLRPGTLVMVRSTVPVGTTRGLIKDLLTAGSGLRAGIDFHLAFTPERTLEGKAMQELLSLPQIVGGLTEACTMKASTFWNTISERIVLAESLEAAELIKLINNSFRDLSFAFANGLALLASQYNLDAGRLVESANDSYPRNPIPKPSPGVGGYCLTKDPFLYAGDDYDAGYAKLARQARALNTEAGRYPLQVLRSYAKRSGVTIESLSVLVAGLAFKGCPETNDLRGSVGIEIAFELLELGCKVLGFDAVVKNADIEALGIEPVSNYDGLKDCDAVLLMNNHPNNVSEDFYKALGGRFVLIFDGWRLLDRSEVELHRNLVYATMGYMTPEEEHNH